MADSGGQTRQQTTATVTHTTVATTIGNNATTTTTTTAISEITPRKPGNPRAHSPVTTAPNGLAAESTAVRRAIEPVFPRQNSSSLTTRHALVRVMKMVCTECIFLWLRDRYYRMSPGKQHDVAGRTDNSTSRRCTCDIAEQLDHIIKKEGCSHDMLPMYRQHHDMMYARMNILCPGY